MDVLNVADTALADQTPPRKLKTDSTLMESYSNTPGAEHTPRNTTKLLLYLDHLHNKVLLYLATRGIAAPQTKHKGRWNTAQSCPLFFTTDTASTKYHRVPGGTSKATHPSSS